uniref:ADAM metallopeptidase domain 33 n=1 Tax=Zonotrichia albicollis TaxID=44394 RepID=A0A8D2MHS7_ZONAL
MAQGDSGGCVDGPAWFRGAQGMCVWLRGLRGMCGWLRGYVGGSGGSRGSGGYVDGSGGSGDVWMAQAQGLSALLWWQPWSRCPLSPLCPCRLLAPGYTETHYSEQGQPLTVTPNHTEHCHYHGHVRGHRRSWVVLSTCSGIRGLIVLSSNTSYYLSPLGPPEPAVPPEQLCGVWRVPRAKGCPSLLSPVSALQARRDAWRTMKYMELFIVADHTLYRNQNHNLGHTKQRIMEIANYVDKFYRLLNIKVALIGLEVWTERDQCAVSSDANATLWAFLQWKKSLKARKRHDNAQLLTGKTFGGTTIGMAPLEGMCSADNSGGVSVDHAEQPIGAAATMAHEIGHNFGLVHDSPGCCTEATPEQGGCVMAAATGHPFPRVFSSCSRRQLESYFQKGGGMCLFNLPDTKDLVVARKCGNGFREEGEDCDCGEVEECTNPCCNAHNCTLKEGAQCAHGDCCHSCKLKVAGTLCREAAGSCDLPEFCTGASPYCPPNVYLLDGSSCAQGQAYCSNGMCMTHQQQCVQLWGPGAWPAPDACFQDVNMAGNTYGNCGKDSQGRYVKCDKRDAMCGKIQCQSSAKKPQGTNTVSIDTTIRLKGREVKCRGTFVYSAKDDQEDLSDPGLVLTGTKCGDGMVSAPPAQGSAEGHLLWVCNSNKNCHCEPGWAPPFCEKPGLGGSVDSGPGSLNAPLRALSLLCPLPCQVAPRGSLDATLRALSVPSDARCPPSTEPHAGRCRAAPSWPRSCPLPPDRPCWSWSLPPAPGCPALPRGQ